MSLCDICINRAHYRGFFVHLTTKQAKGQFVSMAFTAHNLMRRKDVRGYLWKRCIFKKIRANISAGNLDIANSLHIRNLLLRGAFQVPNVNINAFNTQYFIRQCLTQGIGKIFKVGLPVSPEKRILSRERV